MIRRLAGKVPLQVLFIPVVILALAGCKLRVVVPEGGVVISESGAYECLPGKPCNIQVVDIFFNENLIAEPEQGYYFRHWKGGDHTLCADSFNNCQLSTGAFEGRPALEQFLESDEVFFLRPLFALGICEPANNIAEDVFGNVSREEGLQCSDSTTSAPTYQGVVTAYKNDMRVSETGYDQGRLHGTLSLYFQDGIAREEVSEYRDGKLDGAQSKFDALGLPLSITQWQEGKLEGKASAYTYAPTATDKDAAIISTSYYENDQLTGNSTTTYPDGAWETRQWMNGMQFGEYVVFVPNFTDDKILGFRYVYSLSEGLIRSGWSFTRWAIAGSDEYREQPSPAWDCVYVDGVLDEDDCFRDSLVTVGPRL
jgi:antitoxin component YwqK of YwqJK toxin-antitoxin module